jgi:hypothetical protein
LSHVPRVSWRFALGAVLCRVGKRHRDIDRHDDRPEPGKCSQRLALSARARNDRTLHAFSAQAFDGLPALSNSAVAELAQAGLLVEGVDIEVEAARLHALIDELAVHLDLHPERLSAQRCRQLVGVHLGSLMRAEDAKTS